MPSKAVFKRWGTAKNIGASKVIPHTVPHLGPKFYAPASRAVPAGREIFAPPAPPQNEHYPQLPEVVSRMQRFYGGCTVAARASFGILQDMVPQTRVISGE